MDVANQANGLVIGTGDLSELALGWATYNGDHMSMYGVNGSIPKTLVKYLVEWVANNKVDEASRATLLDIVDTPPLLPATVQAQLPAGRPESGLHQPLPTWRLANAERRDGYALAG